MTARILLALTVLSTACATQKAAAPAATDETPSEMEARLATRLTVDLKVPADWEEEFFGPESDPGLERIFVHKAGRARIHAELHVAAIEGGPLGLAERRRAEGITHGHRPGAVQSKDGCASFAAARDGSVLTVTYCPAKNAPKLAIGIATIVPADAPQALNDAVRAIAGSAALGERPPRYALSLTTPEPLPLTVAASEFGRSESAVALRHTDGRSAYLLVVDATWNRTPAERIRIDFEKIVLTRQAASDTIFHLEIVDEDGVSTARIETENHGKRSVAVITCKRFPNGPLLSSMGQWAEGDVEAAKIYRQLVGGAGAAEW